MLNISSQLSVYQPLVDCSKFRGIMNSNEILNELSKLGDLNTKKVLIKNVAKEPFYGVKVADLKKIQKRIKKNGKMLISFTLLNNFPFFNEY